MQFDKGMAEVLRNQWTLYLRLPVSELVGWLNNYLTIIWLQRKQDFPCCQWNSFIAVMTYIHLIHALSSWWKTAHWPWIKQSNKEGYDAPLNFVNDFIIMYIWHFIQSIFNICVRCDMAFIEPMHQNKPNITCLHSKWYSMEQQMFLAVLFDLLYYGLIVMAIFHHLSSQQRISIFFTFLIRTGLFKNRVFFDKCQQWPLLLTWFNFNPSMDK